MYEWRHLCYLHGVRYVPAVRPRFLVALCLTTFCCSFTLESSFTNYRGVLGDTTSRNDIRLPLNDLYDSVCLVSTTTGLLTLTLSCWMKECELSFSSVKTIGLVLRFWGCFHSGFSSYETFSYFSMVFKSWGNIFVHDYRLPWKDYDWPSSRDPFDMRSLFLLFLCLSINNLEVSHYSKVHVSVISSPFSSNFTLVLMPQWTSIAALSKKDRLWVKTKWSRSANHARVFVNCWYFEGDFKMATRAFSFEINSCSFSFNRSIITSFTRSFATMGPRSFFSAFSLTVNSSIFYCNPSFSSIISNKMSVCFCLPLE